MLTVCTGQRAGSQVDPRPGRSLGVLSQEQFLVALETPGSGWGYRAHWTVLRAPRQDPRPRPRSRSLTPTGQARQYRLRTPLSSQGWARGDHSCLHRGHPRRQTKKPDSTVSEGLAQGLQPLLRGSWSSLEMTMASDCLLLFNQQIFLQKGPLQGQLPQVVWHMVGARTVWAEKEWKG